VDLANVLYTDVDTIFMGDVNACSLPSPRILAAAGEVTKLSPANAGVIYLNLTAWADLHGDLMHHAAKKGWIFPNADQEWLFTFFGDRVAVLPDTYNWKPYWGHPQPGTWGRAPAIRILHIHGPKLQARRGRPALAARPPCVRPPARGLCCACARAECTEGRS